MTSRTEAARLYAAADIAEADLDATLMWLRHSGIVGRAERVRFGARLLLGSVAAQAVVLGVLRCGYCMDSGCSVCSPVSMGRR